MSPAQQIAELQSIVGHLQKEWNVTAPRTWVLFFLRKLEVRLSVLRTSQLEYRYQPDAKKLIEHAMVALEDELGARATHPLREKLKQVLYEVRSLERSVPLPHIAIEDFGYALEGDTL